MSIASFVPNRLATALPARISGAVRFAARRRRWLALALLLACALHGTWRGVALHLDERDTSRWWSERSAALHGAMALANVIANIADVPGEWSLVNFGDGRTALRKGAAIRILPETVTKADSGRGIDDPLAKIILPKGDGAVPIVWIGGGSRRLCINLVGNTPSTYLGRRLELGTYVDEKWAWTSVWGPPRRMYEACERLPENPEQDDQDIPGRLERNPIRTFGLRVGQPARDADANR